MTEDLTRSLAGADHRHHPLEGDVVERLACLQQRRELFEEVGDGDDIGRLVARDAHFVATNTDAGGREALFDLAEVVVTRPDQCGHHVGAGDDNSR